MIFFQNVQFIFVGNNNYHQIVNAYLEIDTTVRNTPGNFINANNVRLINNAFAYCFKEGLLSITGGSDLEHNNNAGQVSTIMRLLTSKDSDLSSCFDKNGEKELTDNIVSKQIIINNLTIDVNKGKIRGQLPLEQLLGFCQTFKNITNILEFHLKFKMNDLQDIIFTTVATDMNKTINSLYLYLSIIFPNSQTQVLFNELIIKYYRFTFDSWYTERKISNDGREHQVDIGSAQHLISPKYFIAAFQTNKRIGTPYKANPSNI